MRFAPGTRESAFAFAASLRAIAKEPATLAERWEQLPRIAIDHAVARNFPELGGGLPGGERSQEDAGQQHGPVPLETLRDLLTARQVSAEEVARVHLDRIAADMRREDLALLASCGVGACVGSTRSSVGEPPIWFHAGKTRPNKMSIAVPPIQV